MQQRSLALLLMGLLLMAGCRKSSHSHTAENGEPVTEGPIHFVTAQQQAGIQFKHFNSRRDSL
ncbi:MAG: hypothetical protein ABGX05_04715, partial [Pirellulaceae bacterium]